MDFDFEHQPAYVRKKCKGFTLVQEPSEVIVGGYIRYFTRTTPPEFKMGGKVTKNAILFYEFEYKNTCYTICAKKYNVLFKPAKPRRSRNYHLFKALLKSLDDNTCVYNKDDSTKDA